MKESTMRSNYTVSRWYSRDVILGTILTATKTGLNQIKLQKMLEYKNLVANKLHIYTQN